MTTNAKTMKGDAESTLDPFRRLIMAEPDSLRWRLRGVVAERLAALNYNQRRAITALSCTPDLLAPLGLQVSEVHHTQLLRWILDPHEHPILGQAPFDAVMAMFRLHGQGHRRALDVLHRAQLQKVVAEYVLPNRRRVDLALAFTAGWIFIENKIDSTENNDQLKAYQDFLDKCDKQHCVLVYLTVDPEDQPSVDRCVHITWQHMLECLLPVAIAGDSDEHRYLARYLASVARHVVRVSGEGPFEMWSVGEQHEALDLVEGKN